MKKYKNISDFRQSITINGKRILINPGEVISSQKEIKCIFLSEVIDDLEDERDKEKEEMVDIQKFIQNQKEINKKLIKEVEMIKNAILTIQNDIYDVQENSSGEKKLKDEIKDKVEIFVVENVDDENRFI